VNPEFISETELSSLSDDDIELREQCGYASHARVHAGRLCIPMLNDSGATCNCITEKQVMLLVNYIYRILSEGTITQQDYNYPITQIYRYKTAANLKGAEGTAKMVVELAVVLRIEFIPEGSTTCPAKDIYFTIFKKGTCGIFGGVFGWPQLDHPTVLNGEGLGWVNKVDGVEYSALGVTIPRLDDHRKATYNASTARYAARKAN